MSRRRLSVKYEKTPYITHIASFNFITAITFKFILLLFRDSVLPGKRFTNIGVTGCLQYAGKTIPVCSFGVLEMNYADGQTDTTSLHAFTLCSECTHTHTHAHTINECSIKLRFIVLKPLYMKNRVLRHVTPFNLAQL